jgi:hypothetical protein
MARLPTPGGDSGVWGDVLNAFLDVEHNTDGSLKRSADIDTALTRYTKPGAGIPITDLTSGLQTTLTNALQKNEHVVYARDYGAVFDNATNDSVALQAAIAAAITANKPLLLGAGTAIVGAPLTISGPITIIGMGREETILKAANGLNDYVITFAAGAGNPVTGAHFADFAVDGNADNQTAGGGISADGAVQCSFERVHCYSSYNWGLKLGPMQGGAYGHHNRVLSCLFDNSNNSDGFGGGVWLTGSDENWLIACDFENLGGALNPVGSRPVALLDQAGLQHFISLNFVGGGNNCIGIRIQDQSNTRIIGSTFDGVAGDNIFIVGSSNIVANNLFASTGDQGNVAASAIHLEFGAHYNIVSGNNIQTDGDAGKTRSLIREESTGGSGDNLIVDNVLVQNAAPTVALVESAGANTILRNNLGWRTEATGAATVANGTTSIAVTHTLAAAPALANISVTPTNSMGTATKFWISGVGATQFTINVNTDPGATTATFVWNAWF